MVDLILGVLCEVRAEAHYEAHGGLVADSLYHVAQGERPTCGAEESPKAESSQYDSDPPGKKSRYCSKRWFC
jgi:hypothetical protein